MWPDRPFRWRVYSHHAAQTPAGTTAPAQVGFGPRVGGPAGARAGLGPDGAEGGTAAPAAETGRPFPPGKGDGGGR